MERKKGGLLLIKFVAQFFATLKKEIMENLYQMRSAWQNISLHAKRIFLAVAVYMVSTSMTYFSHETPRGVLPDSSLTYHSDKLGRFTFSGEVIPFDSPLIMRRYKYAMKRNKTYSKSNANMIQASRRWYPLMDPILKKHGIPDDFKYIAAAESKFVHARSPKGAAGFWQLVPNTARGYGLEVNEEVDERYHPIKSTEVACKLMKETYRIFGDWTSVALAYNVGSTALYRLKKMQRIDNVHFIKSNRETENYFFRVMASKDLIENPKKYGYRIKGGQKISEVKTIQVTESILDLNNFAVKNRTTVTALKNFNPWLRSNSLTIKDSLTKSYTLLVPITQETTKVTFVASQIEPDTLSKNILKSDSTVAQ